MEKFNHFPVEIKLEILKRLPVESIFMTCRSVCKEWKRIGYHPLVDYVKESLVDMEEKFKKLIDECEEGEEPNSNVKTLQRLCCLLKEVVIKVTEESAGVAVAAASDEADANLVKAIRYGTCAKHFYTDGLKHDLFSSPGEWDDDSADEWEFCGLLD